MSESPTCRHTHTRLIAKDKDAEFLECLDCSALFEVGELQKAPAGQASGSEPSGATTATGDESPSDESLSDA